MKILLLVSLTFLSLIFLSCRQEVNKEKLLGFWKVDSMIVYKDGIEETIKEQIFMDFNKYDDAIVYGDGGRNVYTYVISNSKANNQFDIKLSAPNKSGYDIRGKLEDFTNKRFSGSEKDNGYFITYYFSKVDKPSDSILNSVNGNFDLSFKERIIGNSDTTIVVAEENLNKGVKEYVYRVAGQEYIVSEGRVEKFLTEFPNAILLSSQSAEISKKKEPQPVSSANGTIYRNSKYKFRIAFPEGWEQDKGTSQTTVARALNREMVATISVGVHYVEGVGKAADIYKVYTEETLKSEFRNLMKSLNGTIPSNIIVTRSRINNIPAYKITMETTEAYQQGGKTVEEEYINIQHQFLKGSAFYNLSLNVPKSELSKVVQAFDRTCNSFYFEP